VLVLGLLLIGARAHQDGLFAYAGQGMSRLPGSPLAIYVAAMALTAGVTVVLNLDTSAAFVTPVLVHLARRRGLSESRLLYGCVFMSNAASLLLPGSNLTNLLVLGGQGVNGLAYLMRMLPPFTASVLTTAVVVALLFRAQPGEPEQSAPAPRPHPLAVLPVLGAAALMLALSRPSLPVLALGLGVWVLGGRGVASWRIPLRSVDVGSLASVFLLALALGTLARLWSLPGRLMATASGPASAAIAAGASVLINNLPAAVLLGSNSPAHPVSLLLGLDLGPNLAVTGSLSALIWWQAASQVGARPSAWRYSMAGVILVPISLLAALAALHTPLR